MLRSSVRDEVADLLASGHRILAIKLVREKTGSSLLEAKRLVEELEAEPDMQMRIASSRSSGMAAVSAAGRPWLFALLFVLGFGGAGVGMLCGAAVVYTRQQQIVARAIRLEGEVVQLVRRDDAYAPVFEFELDGRAHTYQSPTASRPASVSVGEKVALWVDPGDPTRVVVDTFVERYLMLVILGPMGILFTLIGLVPFATMLFKREARDESRGHFIDPMRTSHG